MQTAIRNCCHASRVVSAKPEGSFGRVAQADKPVGWPMRPALDWHGYAEKIKAPYRVAAGGADELCPIAYPQAFVAAPAGSRQLMIYQDSRHGVGGVPSTYNGPEPRTYQTESLARLAGKTFKNECWYIEANGKLGKTAL
jgi:hypothetical protein